MQCLVSEIPRADELASKPDLSPCVRSLTLNWLDKIILSLGSYYFGVLDKKPKRMSLCAVSNAMLTKSVCMGRIIKMNYTAWITLHTEWISAIIKEKPFSRPRYTKEWHFWHPLIVFGGWGTSTFQVWGGPKNQRAALIEENSVPGFLGILGLKPIRKQFTVKTSFLVVISCMFSYTRLQRDS